MIEVRRVSVLCLSTLVKASGLLALETGGDFLVYSQYLYKYRNHFGIRYSSLPCVGGNGHEFLQFPDDTCSYCYYVKFKKHR